jgi:oligopeptide/dipeptide ABC transporter ATP-binding protein
MGAVSAAPLLSARGLRVEAEGSAGPVALVDGVDLELAPGETLAVVGESGAGKSLTLWALLDLVPPPARRAGGTVALEGGEGVRGAGIGLVPQDPAASLDPVRRVGAQVAETVRAHRRCSRAEAREAAAAALAEVGLPRDDYPHRLSGGQRQRATIAVALAAGPRVLLADEPTSALDPGLGLEVLDLLDARRRERGLGLLVVSHDIGAVARVAARVAVMYAGRIVEEGPAAAVLRAPRHPYTAGLLASLPRAGAGRARAAIPGEPPEPGRLPPGCPFAPRCPARRPACDEARPPLRDVGGGRAVACVLDEGEAAAVRARMRP